MHIHDVGEFIFGCMTACAALFVITLGIFALRRPKAMPMLFFIGIAILQTGLSFSNFNRAFGYPVDRHVAFLVVSASIAASLVACGYSFRMYIFKQVGKPPI